jgi:hypothetical protein
LVVVICKIYKGSFNEYLMKNRTLTDLHCHLTDGYDIFWKEGIPIVGGKNYYGLFQPRGDIPEKLLGIGLDKIVEQSSSALIGLVNFDDYRAQRVLEGIKKFIGSSRMNQDQSLLTVRYGPHNLGLIIGQEIITDRGDLLLLGIPENIKDKKLEDVLKRAKQDYNSLIFGCHLGKPRSLTLGDVEKYASYFDGVNVQNELGVPVYATSDSHTLKGIFRSFTIMKDLDFTDAEKLKDSIRRALKSGDIETGGRSEGILEHVRHIASVVPWLVCNQLNKRGLGILSPLKRDYE